MEVDGEVHFYAVLWAERVFGLMKSSRLRFKSPNPYIYEETNQWNG
jgi:hypothetical protein